MWGSTFCSCQRTKSAKFSTQAKHLILHGERYYLNDEDEALIRQTNESFEVQSPMELLFLTAFSVPSDEDDCLWLTTTQILERLSTLPTYNKKTDCSVVKLGRVLTRLNLVKRRSQYGYEYLVKSNR